MEEAKPKRKVVMVKVVKGTPDSCSKCKWGLPDSNEKSRGVCVAFRTTAGFGIRLIGDFFNTTCDNYAEGPPEVVENLTIVHTQITGGKASG